MPRTGGHWRAMKQKCGLDHPDTQTMLERLAEVLEAQRSYDEASVLRKYCVSGSTSDL